jgi:hypothetical protein
MLYNPQGVARSSEEKGQPCHSAPFELCLFCACGLCLSPGHTTVTDMGFQSFCALSKSINCDTVSQSPYSILGPLPVAVWGVAGYGFFLLLLVFSAFPSAGRRRYLCLVAAIIFRSAPIRGDIEPPDRQLLYPLHRHLCDQFPAGVFQLDHPAAFSSRPTATGIHPGSAISLAETKIQYACLNGLYDRDALDAPFLSAVLADRLAVRGHVDQHRHHRRGYPGSVQVLLDIVSSPIVVFQCRKMHCTCASLWPGIPTRSADTCNFPMDHEFNPIVTEPFHVGSGQMALLAIHAAASGKFVEFNDLLFAKAASGKAIDLAEVARESGIDPRELQQALTHEPYKRHLLRDIRQGMKLRIAGTPSYWIKGNVYEGSIPAEILKSVIE